MISAVGGGESVFLQGVTPGRSTALHTCEELGIRLAQVDYKRKRMLP